MVILSIEYLFIPSKKCNSIHCVYYCYLILLHVSAVHFQRHHVGPYFTKKKGKKGEATPYRQQVYSK